MIKKSLLGFFSLVQLFVYAQNDAPKAQMTAEQYIEKYSPLAVEEMFRSRIPASITIAQGILESGNGNSRLATEAKNHFGIKCKNTWKGDTISEDDDAPQECFRKYDAVIDSYRDHSEFLLKGQRYAFLFDLKSNDYKAWAYGLKKAGYATNPQYPELLIAFIERHNLQRFDETKISNEESKDLHEAKIDNIKNYGKEISVNEVPAIVTKPHQSLAEIALNYDLKVYQLYKYNDFGKNATLQAGDTVYLKNKKNKAQQDFYVVGMSDNMHSISQRFAIKLGRLYERNNIKEGQEPQSGEKLFLNLNRKTRLKLREAVLMLESVKEIPIDKALENDSVYENPEKNIATMPASENTSNKLDTAEEKKSELSFFYTIQAGETLYGIAKKYNVRVDALQYLNNIQENTIQVGQRIIINPNLPSADTKEPQAQPGNHVVRQGETLFSIAKIYNISLSELKALNDKVSDDIQLGENLIVVPIKETETIEIVEVQTPASESFYHVVEKGETLFAIARKYNVNIATLRRINESSLSELKSGDKVRIR